ncbi:HEAT repeat domain-containing protein [uncultured Roseibium sp.]|uniref:HEAT repeat domain-containing protein n=1 Tax=uncultured Roseibium sp. TaxID=1936171 RepID=UPI002611020B|nr:HEAT repeat domain-containing protein [uncultured Roseibium sp.]
MRWKLAIVAVAIATAITVVSGGVGAEQRRSTVTNSFNEASLFQAFEAVKTGDYGPLGQLPAPTAAAISALERLLADNNETVRREAVTMLGRIDDPATAPVLAGALSDPVDDIATRAAAAIYRLGPDAIQPGVGDQIRKAVENGLTAGGAILILAHDPATEETIAVLRELRDARGDELTEVSPPSPAVSMGLMVDTALAKLGDAQAEDRLTAAAGSGDLATAEFLLSALREIDSPRVIEALAAVTLADSRPVQGDAPSGAETGMRLADLAATRFAARFDLAAGIDDLADERLPDQTIEAVKAELENYLAAAR